MFLDHVGWFVPDMEEAGRQMERLGFILTPFVAQYNADPDGGAPVPAGTGNRCAMLQRGYLEFLAAVPGVDTPLSRQLNAALDRYAGLHLIAFTVDDAAAAHARLEREGFGPQAPVHLRRPITLANGDISEVAFTVIRVAADTMAEGRIQMLRQETPDIVWQENLVARDNGIAALAGVLLCVDDPAAVAARYARFSGKAASGDDQYSVLQLDRGRLAFATPDRCAELLPGLDIPATPFMAAVGLEAQDLTQLKSMAAERGLDLLPTDDGMVRISSKDAAGVTLIIFISGESWPPAPD